MWESLVRYSRGSARQNANEGWSDNLDSIDTRHIKPAADEIANSAGSVAEKEASSALSASADSKTYKRP
jgi:hypothetical protein